MNQVIIAVGLFIATSALAGAQTKSGLPSEAPVGIDPTTKTTVVTTSTAQAPVTAPAKNVTAPVMPQAPSNGIVSVTSSAPAPQTASSVAPPQAANAAKAVEAQGQNVGTETLSAQPK